MELSTSVELRAPVNPRDSSGEYMVLLPGSDEPQHASESGGYFRAATFNAVVVWLGPSGYNDSPGSGVIDDRVVGGFPTKYWISEWRASPMHWNPEELLLSAAPVVRRVLTWIERFSPGSKVVNGRIVPAEPPPAIDFSRPPPSGDVGGQTSGWLPNGDGGNQIRAETARLYIRRDKLVRDLAGGAWPRGVWKRVHPKIGNSALDNGDVDWVGLLEAKPPSNGLLHGMDGKRRKRRLWSAAEILAWGLDGWEVHGAWLPDATDQGPFQISAAPCAPMRNLAAFHLFHELAFSNPEGKYTLTMAWLTSRGRALVAPAAKAVHQWFAENAGIGRVYGQHVGSLYMTTSDDVLADALAVVQDAQPLIAVPGNAWRRAEEVHPEASSMGSEARENIQAALDKKGALPAAAWQDLLSFGSTEQLLAADAAAPALAPAYTAPAPTLPSEGGSSTPHSSGRNPGEPGYTRRRPGSGPEPVYEAEGEAGGGKPSAVNPVRRAS